GAELGRAEAIEPVLDHRRAAAARNGKRDLRDQRSDAVCISCCIRMVERALSIASSLVPVGGARMQCLNQPRLLFREVVQQKLAAELMEPVPPTGRERDEEVLAREPLECVRGAFGLKDGVA